MLINNYNFLDMDTSILIRKGIFVTSKNLNLHPLFTKLKQNNRILEDNEIPDPNKPVPELIIYEITSEMLSMFFIDPDQAIKMTGYTRNYSIFLFDNVENDILIKDLKLYTSEWINYQEHLRKIKFEKINIFDGIIKSDNKITGFVIHPINFISIINLINNEYSSFFTNKNFSRKSDNYVNFVYTRNITPLQIDIKLSGKKKIEFSIKGEVSGYKLQYLLDVLSSLIIKSASIKIKNVFKSENTGLVIPDEGISNIKLLKSTGIELNSRKCQKERQPVITTEFENNEQYLQKDKVIFKCTNDEYKYTGFLEDGSICCFKNSQLNKNHFLQNKKVYKTQDEKLFIDSDHSRVYKLNNNKFLLTTIDGSKLNKIGISVKMSDLINTESKSKKYIFTTNKELNKGNIGKYNDEYMRKGTGLSNIEKILLDSGFVADEYDSRILKSDDYLPVKYNVNIIITGEDCKIIYDNIKNYIVLSKTGKYYDFITDKNNKYIFSKKENIIKDLCKKEDIFKSKITAKKIIKKYENIIKSQILDKNNKIVFLVTKNNILLPVYPTKGAIPNLSIMENSDVPFVVLNDETLKLYKKIYDIIIYTNDAILLQGYLPIKVFTNKNKIKSFNANESEKEDYYDIVVKRMNELGV